MSFSTLDETINFKKELKEKASLPNWKHYEPVCRDCGGTETLSKGKLMHLNKNVQQEYHILQLFYHIISSYSWRKHNYCASARYANV